MKATIQVLDELLPTYYVNKFINLYFYQFILKEIKKTIEQNYLVV